ncbi:MAG: hypothetical protein IPN22_05690 [Bacteroidetes bacterium]|nr:hypothetical protein [Bacteroidota bacterium]
MEEKMINHFDKKIEQAMNAYTEAPPFGMWNRISAELGEPVAAPVAPKPHAVFTKSSVLGFLSGVLLIGGIVTANMLYNSTLSYETPTVANQVSIPADASPFLVAQPVAQKVVAEPKVNAKMFSPKMLTINKAETSTASVTKVQENEQVMPAAQEIQADKTFYFPPVDIETSSEELSEQSIEAAVTFMNHTTVFKESEKAEEKSSKVISAKEQRLKFHPRKKRSHTWGTINRRNTKNK